MNSRLHKLLVALVLVIFASRSSAESLSFSQARLGNIFISTDPVQIPLQTTGTQISWTVKDFFGFQTTGSSTVSNGSATITPGLGQLGFFELHATALRNGLQVASADTTFAVVAPANVSTMRDSPFGVMTHFAQGWTTSVMQLLARGGIAQFRDEQYWQNVEPTPGSYTFTNYQAYMATAATLGLNPLMELDFANSNYDGGYTPYTAAGRTAYANYAKALLGQYGSQIDTVEVWNEYNGSFFTNPVTNPAPNRAVLYTDMLKKTYTEIKSVRPDVRVVGGACVPVPLPWFKDLFDQGALDYMDVIDAHPYRSIPEGVELDIAALRDLSATYNHGNGPKPVWATECGAPDTVNPGRQDMASYLVRLMTLMRSAGVERIYWYLAYDYDGYSTGLVRSPYDPMGPYVPSAAFPAYSNLIQQIYGATYIGRDNTDARTRMYLFHRGSSDVRVVWSSIGTTQLVLSSTTPLTRIDIMGKSSTLQPINGAIAITADTTPYYLIGSITAVRELGRDTIVADTVRDFSGVQGPTNGTWSYLNEYIPSGAAYNPNGLEPLTYRATPYGYEYAIGYPHSRVDAGGGHPGAREGYAVTYPVWSVRRWLSSVTTTARITGTIIRASPYGDGTGARIYVDGNLVYSTIVGGAGVGATVNFSFTTPLLAGSKVDFILTPGPAIDVDFDYVDFRAQISVPPPPPTTFAAWQNQNFTAAESVVPGISDETATPAGDGVRNLLKYAASLPAKSVTPANAIATVGQATVGGSKYLTLSYRKAIAATDLSFVTEVKEAGLAGSWVTGGIPLGTPVVNGDGTQTVTIRDDVAITPSVAGRFMRLNVTRQ